MNEHIWQDYPVDTSLEPADWLARQGQRHALTILLAHAFDGVIWGRIETEPDAAAQLLVAGQAFPTLDTPLRWETLLEACLFGPAAMLQLWRTEDGHFAASLVTDPADADAWFDETYHLWGQPKQTSAAGFTLLKEGQQGLLHAPPLAVPANRGAALAVRHYLAYDDEDQAYICGSRLVDLIDVPGGTHGLETP